MLPEIKISTLNRVYLKTVFLVAITNYKSVFTWLKKKAGIVLVDFKEQWRSTLYLTFSVHKSGITIRLAKEKLDLLGCLSHDQ